jgi:hypothetical protein
LRRKLDEARNVEIKHAKCEDEIAWLMEKDDLILLVDPFRIHRTSEAFGVLSHRMLAEILQKSVEKSRAVISLWWSKGRDASEHRPTCELLSTWEGDDEHGRRLRIFHDNHNHVNALLGCGEGVSVVDGIPNRLVWKRSWLKDFVFESSRARPNHQPARHSVN